MLANTFFIMLAILGMVYARGYLQIFHEIDHDQEPWKCLGYFVLALLSFVGGCVSVAWLIQRN